MSPDQTANLPSDEQMKWWLFCFSFAMNFYCSRVALQCCASSHWTTKRISCMIHTCICVYPFWFACSSHLGDRRALRFPEPYSGLSLGTCFIHSISSVCTHANPSLPVHPATSLHPCCPGACSSCNSGGVSHSLWGDLLYVLVC